MGDFGLSVRIPTQPQLDERIRARTNDVAKTKNAYYKADDRFEASLERNKNIGSLIGGLLLGGIGTGLGIAQAGGKGGIVGALIGAAVGVVGGFAAGANQKNEDLYGEMHERKYQAENAQTELRAEQRRQAVGYDKIAAAATNIVNHYDKNENGVIDYSNERAPEVRQSALNYFIDIDSIGDNSDMYRPDGRVTANDIYHDLTSVYLRLGGIDNNVNLAASGEIGSLTRDLFKGDYVDR